MAQVIWTARANREFQTILSVIEREVGATARTKWRRKIEKAVKALERFPEIGFPVEDYGIAGLREQITTPYRIIYVYVSNACRIVKVVRADRDLEAVMSLVDLL